MHNDFNVLSLKGNASVFKKHHNTMTTPKKKKKEHHEEVVSPEWHRGATVRGCHGGRGGMGGAGLCPHPPVTALSWASVASSRNSTHPFFCTMETSSL